MERVAFVGIPSWVFELSEFICGQKRSLYFRAERSSYAGDNGRTPGPGWRKCTAYRQTGPGGLPLALRLSEGLGVAA